MFLLLYADDAVIFSETREDLQHGIDILYDYCKRWRLEVNIQKTKIVVFRKGGRLSHYDHWFYGDLRLCTGDTFLHLGVLFSSNVTGKLSQAQSTLAHQALKAEFSLQRMLYNFNDVKPDFISQLFDKLITPILMYASEVWGFHTAAAIERVQTGCCKRILHLKKYTSNNFIYGELNRLPK